jgi:hypothetical protein
MSIKDEYSVRSIDSDQYKEWILKKHYAKRMPQVIFAFGLFDASNTLSACITFGRMATASVEKHWSQHKLHELNRLVAKEGLPRNALSWFISKALNLLPPPMIVISYADTSMNHHGYIYQATNWIYTGLSDKRNRQYVLSTGKHARHAQRGRENKDDADYIAVERPRKHRYFYFVGNKREVREMKKLLPYPILPYPKGDNQRYDASYEPVIQEVLF